MRTELFKLSDATVTPLSLIFFTLTLVATFLFAALVKRAIFRFLRKSRRADEGLAYAIARIGQYVVLAIGIVFALDNVGVDWAAFAAIGAVVTVGVGFGMQNIAQNFISGLILLVERPVQVGDYIMVGETVGTVVAIEMRATKVVSRDGVAIVVPNSELISSRVVNQSSPTSHKRVTVMVGVGYGSDVAVVREALLAIAAAHPEVLKDPPPTVFFTDFGESALQFELAVWIGHPKSEPAVTSDLRFSIDKEFRARHISIPYPQRDVHLCSVPDPTTRPTGLFPTTDAR